MHLILMMSSGTVSVQVLEAQRRHQKEKSGIIPTSPTPYTYNKARLISGFPAAGASSLLQW